MLWEPTSFKLIWLGCYHFLVSICPQGCANTLWELPVNATFDLMSTISTGPSCLLVGAHVHCLSSCQVYISRSVLSSDKAIHPVIRTSHMYSMGWELRRASPNQDPVVAMVVVAVVAAVSMLENPPNWLEKVGKFHYPLISVGDVENQDIRKVNTVKLWKQVTCYTQASNALHFEWMALWLKAASTRAPSILELQGRSLCQRQDYNQGFQTSHAFHTLKESLWTDPWRTPRSRKMYAEGKGVSVLARDQWWHLGDCGKVWNLPVNFQSFQVSWKHQ